MNGFWPGSQLCSATDCSGRNTAWSRGLCECSRSRLCNRKNLFVWCVLGPADPGLCEEAACKSKFKCAIGRASGDMASHNGTFCSWQIMPLADMHGWEPSLALWLLQFAASDLLYSLS